jgi:pyruvate,water dikinase
MALIKTFREITKSDTAIAGGKGASLGEMTQARIPVPDGFVILSNAFDLFLEETDLNVEIDAVLNEVNTKEIHTVENASEKIQAMILSKTMPNNVQTEISKFYKKLDCDFVAVRSSATLEDSASAAWAGQLESYLNTTEKTLLENVKKCWASLFTPRAIFYRFEQKLHKDKVSVAVVVQKMIQAEESGVAFSVHPVTQDENQIIIEAGFGLGEAIVSGSITPDSYVVDKQGFKILDINVNEQAKALYKKANGGNKWKELAEKGKKQVLNEKEIIELSKLIVKIENHYGFPCDIEWAREANNFFITQSRPITTIEQKEAKPNSEKMIEKFLSETQPEDVFKMSFEFIPLFWTIPIFFLDKNLGDKFTPTLLIKHKEESHLFIDSNFIFGYAKNVLENYLNNNDKTLQKVENKYRVEVENTNNLYNGLLEDKKYTEEELNLLIKENLKIFKDFFVSCSLAYLDHGSIFDLIENYPKINAKKIKEILEIDIHKSFELIHEEIILKFKEGKNTDYQSLSYLFTSYSKIPKKTEVKQAVEKVSLSTLKQSIQNKNQNLETNLKKYEKLYEKLNLKEKQLVDFIQMIKRIREDRKQYFSKLFFSLHKISELLLRNWKITEIKNGDIFAFELLKGKKYAEKIKNEILKRDEGYIFYCDSENEPTSKPFSGNTESELKELKDTISKTDLDFIKGEIAYKGKVSGKVAIAIKNKDFSKIKENDILVTSMTRPEVLPYLKKVKAIITDEGGVTCHAAIISRELKKPCIIGTKTATHILNDGDLVEVDANSGKVIILRNQHTDYPHFKGNNLSRSEKIQREVVEMILNSDIPNEKRESSDIWELKHSSGCCQVGRILAEKRDLNVELVEIIAVLHDIAVVTTGSYKDHAKKGGVVTKKILEKSNDFSTEEIKTICDGVAHHSEKDIYTDNPYIEIAKDLDAFDCCLYEGSINYYKIHKPKDVFEKYCDRIRKVRKELGLQTDKLFRE